MLKIINFTKKYGKDKIAVDNINLEVSSGDLFGFIGHNGAGKSTTIKSVVGILSFDEGDILIDGVSIKKDPISCKKKIAYIPDNPDVYESITGIAYLNLVADIFKVDKDKRREVIEKYSSLLNLTKEELASLTEQLEETIEKAKSHLAYLS